MDRIARLAQRIVAARWFEFAIIALSLATARVHGRATADGMGDGYGGRLETSNQVIRAVVIVGALLIMTAFLPGARG